MPITIDEVTAEVAPPEERERDDRAPQPQPPAPSELRRQREYFNRLEQRAARVRAN
jgi:hypothetical protein